jgi:hypothetical protein
MDDISRCPECNALENEEHDSDCHWSSVTPPEPLPEQQREPTILLGQDGEGPMYVLGRLADTLEPPDPEFEKELIKFMSAGHEI